MRACIFLFLILSLLLSRGASAVDFVQQARIMASDGAANDEFGGRFGRTLDLSTDGSTAILSSGQADCDAGPDCGAAYVFVRTLDGWVQQAKLTAPDAVPGDQPIEVALSGDGNMALVGASFKDCSAGSDCGAVYFFVRYGTTWSFQQKLTSSDLSAGDNFGGALALSADGAIALIGAPSDDCGSVSACGAVYAFTRSGSLWTERQKFSGDPGHLNTFGAGLTISEDGNTAVIFGDGHGGAVAGRAYVFIRNGDLWNFQAKLAPLNPVSSFPISMDLSANGDVVLILEYNPDFMNYYVRVFTLTGTAWSSEATLFESGIGRALALSDDGETALTKGLSCHEILGCEVAHVYRHDQGTWKRVQTLRVLNFVDIAKTGSVTLSGDGRTALIADPGAPCASGSDCGAAYIFAALSVLDVPTASGLGLLLLALLLAASGAWVLAKSRRSA